MDLCLFFLLRRSTSYEVGTEFRLFNNRLWGDFNYYTRDDKDQIISVTSAPQMCIRDRYGQAIDKIIYWLDKALGVAEDAQQKIVIEKLIRFYKNGDLKDFDGPHHCPKW